MNHHLRGLFAGLPSPGRRTLRLAAAIAVAIGVVGFAGCAVVPLDAGPVVQYQDDPGDPAYREYPEYEPNADVVVRVQPSIVPIFPLWDYPVYRSYPHRAWRGYRAHPPARIIPPRRHGRVPGYRHPPRHRTDRVRPGRPDRAHRPGVHRGRHGDSTRPGQRPGHRGPDRARGPNRPSNGARGPNPRRDQARHGGARPGRSEAHRERAARRERARQQRIDEANRP